MIADGVFGNAKARCDRLVGQPERCMIDQVAVPVGL
jgi:hypothetical protein